MTNTEKAVMAIWECVTSFVRCYFCDRVLEGEDAHEVAEAAYESGWRVRKDEVRCPKCINKVRKS